MKILTVFWFLFSIFVGISAGVKVRANFVKSFILNEQKPTVLILCDICWSDNEKIHLANEISKIGSKISSSIHNRTKYQDHSIMFLMDLDCPQAKQAIDLASSSGLFKGPYRWLVLSNSTDEHKLHHLWRSPLLTDSEVVLAERREYSYVMTELHKPSVNHTMVFTPRGFYNVSSRDHNSTKSYLENIDGTSISIGPHKPEDSDGSFRPHRSTPAEIDGAFFDTRSHRSKFRRRMDLMGHILTMSNVIQDSNKSTYHLPLEDGLDFQNDPIAKVSWMNAKVAFEMLNATPRYIFSYRWGYKVNGQWSGMINDVHTGQADIGTNCIVSDIERLSVVTYTDTLAPFKVRFIFRQPPLSYVTNIYSLPFRAPLWVGTAVCALVSTMAVCIAARWERRTLLTLDTSHLNGGISDALLWTISALSQQGSNMELRRTPGRIIGVVVFTALMALYAAYSANIVVLLQAPSHSIKTLAQLANSKITLAANDVDYNHFIFKQYKDPVRVAIYKRIEPLKGKLQFYDLHEGVERIRKGLFAFHSLESQIYARIEETFTASEKCDLTDIDFMNALDPYAPMKKDSPYLELMRVAFKRMRETGIHTALTRRYHIPKPICSNKGSAFSSVGISDLKPVLALMGIGIGTSFGVLLVEITVFKMKQKMLQLLENEPRYELNSNIYRNNKK